MQTEHLFGGSVIRNRWVLDILQLLKCSLTLLWGVQAEGALPHCSYSLHEGPFGVCGPGIVRRGGAFALW